MQGILGSQNVIGVVSDKRIKALASPPAKDPPKNNTVVIIKVIKMLTTEINRSSDDALVLNQQI